MAENKFVGGKAKVKFFKGTNSASFDMVISGLETNVNDFLSTIEVSQIIKIEYQSGAGQNGYPHTCMVAYIEAPSS